jgi:hypothetical protein
MSCFIFLLGSGRDLIKARRKPKAHCHHVIDSEDVLRKFVRRVSSGLPLVIQGDARKEACDVEMTVSDERR